LFGFRFHFRALQYLRDTQIVPKHISINGIHAQRLKQIRKFVDFDFDLRKPLSKYQKAKIKKYHHEIDALPSRPYHAYRSKDKKRLQRAQEFAQHEKRLPGLKVAFIPTDGEHRPKIRVNKKGEITATTDHVITRGLELDTFELLENPVEHVNAVIAGHPDAKSFTVKAGRFEIPQPHSRATIANYVARLTARYYAGAGHHYHGNWLHGLSSHQFKNQADFNDYNKTKNANKKKRQKDRRNAKARAKRAKQK